jgi:hypothetical protein
MVRPMSVVEANAADDVATSVPNEPFEVVKFVV